jgi:parallel beta-helix repeat protein/predicted outer membrane repeat protein
MSKKLAYLTSFVLVLGLAGRGWPDASNPSPDDGAIYNSTWATLSWQRGEHSVSFDLYLGDNYEDVKNGTGDTFRGNQIDTFFIVGFSRRPYPDGLVPGTTYYWRIDEVNDLNPDSPWVGEVWSFKITPYTAYAPEPVDGAEFVDPNVILSWQRGLDAKIHYVVFGEDFNEVNNASEGHPQGATIYNPGILEIGKTYYWRIDESDGPGTYKGEVWSFTVGAAAPPDQEPPNNTVEVIYVDADAVGANNGSNWENAYLCLQDALEDNPVEAQIDYEIRVAHGIYKPDRRTSEGWDGIISITSSGDWRDTFVIRNMTVKGGYAGYGEPDPNARDINLYETILSGDLYGNDVDVNNPGDLREEPTRAENSFHVVISQEDSVIDGFIITGGNANESYRTIYNDRGGGLLITSWLDTLQITNCTFTGNSALARGGGIYSDSGNLSLTNCTFTGNQAVSDGGGGIYALHGELNLTDCTFTANQAGSGGGAGIRGNNCGLNLTDCEFIENLTPYGEGGGVATETNFPCLTNCTFVENSARAGGGLYNETSNAALTNCIFKGNSVRDQGGGMYSVGRSLSDESPILRNCLFIANQAGQYGGGIYNYSCEPVLTNCTFAGNSARGSNALYCRSDEERNIVTLTNCILWDGGNEIRTTELSIMNIFYSDIQGGWFGEGNIDENPMFSDPNGPEYDLRLSPLSPCVDSGNPRYVPEPNETDLDGYPRIVGGRVDMGAYECQGIIYVDNRASGGSGQGSLQPDGSAARPFHTIQEAIDVAKDGQTVLVRPGVYSNFDFMGKAITVAGTDDAAVITEPWIDQAGSPKPDAVTFHTGEGRDSVLKNFIIKDNGTAISLNYGSSPTITNLTIVDNDFGISGYENSNPDIRNCIFFNNKDGDLFQCEARYSCFEVETPGAGNITGDPLFVDPNNGDYHLMSEGWRWNMQNGSWTYDVISSPCLDAGDPASPLGDELLSAPRDPDNDYGINLRINMGAYGGTCQASIPPPGWLPQGSETAGAE